MNNRYYLDDLIKKLQSNNHDFTQFYLHTLDLKRENVDVIENQPPQIRQNYYCHINEKSLTRLCQALQQNTTLQKVSFNDIDRDLFRMKWRVEDAEAIGAALKNHPTLKEVYIEFDIDADPYAILGFLQCLTGSAPIESLYLHMHCRYNIPRDFMKKLGDLLFENHSLKSIRIDSSNLFLPVHNCVEEFGMGLVKNKSLENLNLRNFDMTYEDMLLWMDILKEMSSLKHLSLQESMSSNFMPALSNVLKNNPGLEKLNLSSNAVNEAEFQFLIDALPFLPQLKTLIIDKIFDKVSHIPLESLAKVIKQFSLKIENLHIVQIYNGKNYYQHVDQLLEDNLYLKNLFLGNVPEKIIEKCLPLLEDKSKCHLRNLCFANDAFLRLKDSTYVGLVDAMYANENIFITPQVSGKFSNAFTIASINNVKRAKEKFLHQSIELANAFYAKPSVKKSLADLPLEILYIISKMVWSPADSFMQPVNLMFYHQLHLQNFSTRRKLIEEKKYDPRKKSDIHQWWSRDLISPGKNITLFKAETEKKAEKNKPRSIYGAIKRVFGF